MTPDRRRALVAELVALVYQDMEGGMGEPPVSYAARLQQSRAVEATIAGWVRAEADRFAEAAKGRWLNGTV